MPRCVNYDTVAMEGILKDIHSDGSSHCYGES